LEYLVFKQLLPIFYTLFVKPRPDILVTLTYLQITYIVSHKTKTKYNQMFMIIEIIEESLG